jgi:hypothetical protein
VTAGQGPLPGLVATLSDMRCLGLLILTLILLLVVVMVMLAAIPAALSYSRGTRPETESVPLPCGGDDSKGEICPMTTGLRWRLPPGARTDTTLDVSRDDVTSLTGRMTLADQGCADAVVEWQLTFANREVHGVLTAGDRQTELAVPVPAKPPGEVRLRLRRTDTATCTCDFRWGKPQLAAPVLHLPF